MIYISSDKLSEQVVAMVLLLEAGADANIVDSDGRTLLVGCIIVALCTYEITFQHWAAWSGDTHTVQKALEVIEDKNVIDIYGNSALDWWESGNFLLLFSPNIFHVSLCILFILI